MTAVAAGRQLRGRARPAASRRATCRRACSTIPRSSTPSRKPGACTSSRRRSAATGRDRLLSGLHVVAVRRRASKMASWCCCARQTGSDRSRPSGLPAAIRSADRSRRRDENGDRGARPGAQVRQPSPPSITSASKSGAARSSACSVRTAPARPRPFACCAGCCRPPPARCASPASICARRARRRASTSATWRRSSRSTGSSRSAENLDFFASAYGLRGAPQARAHRLGARPVRA